MLGAPPPMISTSAPGFSASGPATVRHASGRLSEAEASVAGATPGGTATSIASANGTLARSETSPPQSPPKDPNPYIDPGRTSRQSPVSPARQRSQAPQEIWKGTTTRSPGVKEVTPSPTATTSATHSCPIATGG